MTWANGEAQELPLISADDALRQLAAAGGGDCPKCVPLEVTFAILTTASFQTSRGPATVPAWEYTLKGTAVRLTRAAVTQAAISRATPTSWHLDYSLGSFITIIVSATTTTGSKQLTVAFAGVPRPGNQPCGADYSAEAAESASAVVVIVMEHSNPAGEHCPEIGARRTATADLAQPLGERAVLEVTLGVPVPVTITP